MTDINKHGEEERQSDFEFGDFEMGDFEIVDFENAVSENAVFETVDFGCDFSGFYDLQARVVCFFFHYWFHRQNLIIGLNYLKREERVRFNLSRFNRY